MLKSNRKIKPDSTNAFFLFIYIYPTIGFCDKELLSPLRINCGFDHISTF